MSDPVVLVETGQIYDRASITEWFRTGNNTCPLTGGAGIPSRSRVECLFVQACV